MSKSSAEDFPASITLIRFDPPLPLLRGPLPACLSDDPSLSPFVLAFKDAPSWKSALQTCQSKLTTQCEGGARIGCSISASSKCKPPWWRTLFGGTTMDFSEREQCEEREMSACLAASEESCLKFAKDKCLAPFGDARIASIDQKEASKFIFRSSKSAAESVSQQRAASLLPNCSLHVTNYRGSSLLGSETSSENSSSENSP